MRRFSSEGNLLDLDFLPWRRVQLNSPDNDKNRDSGTYTQYNYEDEEDGRTASLPPVIQEPRDCLGEAEKKELTKEHSISVENLGDMGKLDTNHLRVGAINEGCRAYSDGQLAPAAQGSTESVEREDLSPSPSSPSTNPFSQKSHHRHHHRAKLSAAKLHLKSLFGGQVGLQATLRLHITQQK